MWIAGVDEAGRGPLAGPVVAAAVILPEGYRLDGLADSKQLDEKQRSELEAAIKQQAVAWATGRAEVEEIEELNILWASMLAMKRAVEALTPTPDLALIDGNRCPELAVQAKAIVKGDQSEPVISAASIIAKQTRDREMAAMDALYPEYGFARHKGYPTRQHLAALEKHGVTAIHRKGYGPVRKLLVQQDLPD